jgi:hypothetical protein
MRHKEIFEEKYTPQKICKTKGLTFISLHPLCCGQKKRIKTSLLHNYIASIPFFSFRQNAK